MQKYIIVHYAEIGLKGRNRKFYENQLIKNIRKKLSDYRNKRIKNIFGRILIEISVNDRDIRKVVGILNKVAGIKYFAFAAISSNKIDQILKASLAILKNRKFSSFKIKTKRASKDYPFASQQINEKVGEYILHKIKGSKVNLGDPDVTLHIELVNKYVFLYFNKLQGIGGLPVGSSNKVLSLISAGIDSPVASYRMMKRGAPVVFLHFHSYPQTSRESIESVKELVSALNQFQLDSKIYFIPFLDFQKEVVQKANTKDRIILYRRMMIRVAELVAVKENVGILVTGESLGQVASQTLENIVVIAQACKNTQVLRPLICYDKDEIIEEAKKIGTYNISSRGHEDCCSLFVPARPNTRADINEIKQQENDLAILKHLKKIENTWEIIN